MADTDWRLYSATITAALITRMPPEQTVSPAQAAELYFQVLQAMKDAAQTPARPGGAAA